jgi:lambda family phage portal protein
MSAQTESVPGFVRTVAGVHVPASYAVQHHAASIASRDLAAWRPPLGSPDADWLPERGTVVSRARDADRNNGIAKGGIQTIVDNVVGSGLRLSARPDYLALDKTKEWAAEWAQGVESLFHSWWWSTACHAGDTLNGDQLSEQALRTELVQGESLTLPLWIADRGDGYGTKLQMVEPDRLSTPTGQVNSSSLREGIRFDRYGQPLGYYIRNAHPGERYLDGFDSSVPTWTFVPRKTDFGRLRVLHCFVQDRSGQSRGKPLLTAVMAHFKQVDRYIGAELMAAVVNGMIAGVIETPMSGDDILELMKLTKDSYLQDRKDHAVQFQSGMMFPLYPGDKLQPFIPQRPAAAFGAFVENVLRIIAVGLDMPYELLVKDFTKTTYSSARASMLEAWRAFRRRRDRFGTGWLDPIYGLFLEEVVNDGRVDAPDFYRNRMAYLRCKWIGPGRGWVDPKNEALAAGARMKAGISTLEDECAEQGLDWREVQDQQAREQERARELDLPQSAGATPSQQAEQAEAADEMRRDEQAREDSRLAAEAAAAATALETAQVAARVAAEDRRERERAEARRAEAAREERERAEAAAATRHSEIMAAAQASGQGILALAAAIAQQPPAVSVASGAPKQRGARTIRARRLPDGTFEGEIIEGGTTRAIVAHRESDGTLVAHID